MLKPAYRIQFSSDGGVDFTGRVRNFAEDLYRALKEKGWGDVPNEAAATDTVSVSVSAARHLGAVLKAIKLQLRRHNLEERGEIVRA
jgi:hypothetical protein